MVCYLELTGLPASELSTIEIYNDLLTDLFEDQKNIVHFTVKEHKKSFVLIKGDNKAMLNLYQILMKCLKFLNFGRFLIQTE